MSEFLLPETAAGDDLHRNDRDTDFSAPGLIGAEQPAMTCLKVQASRGDSRIY
ncbi:MAG: hypothetical protein ACLFV2_06905 [Desulfurivibrionaceae bacterium]